MDELSRAILFLLSEGKCCVDILRERPDLTREHVQRAAAEALRWVEHGEPRSARIQRLRQKHPHAFEPWTPIEDQLLVQQFQSGAPIAAIARTFGRPAGAIRTRLERLGHDPRRSAVKPPPAPPPARPSSTFEWGGGP